MGGKPMRVKPAALMPPKMPSPRLTPAPSRKPLGHGEGLRDGRGRPFTLLQAAGVETVMVDEIMRRRDPALKEAVEASLARGSRRALEKLKDDVGEVKPDNIAGAVAARCLALLPEAREPAASARERSAGMDLGPRACESLALMDESRA